MFSKPLFKQSCKANALVWALVTFATCFMLAVVIVVIGTTDASAIRDSMVKVFQDDYVYAQVEKNAMTYYNITDTALDAYETHKSDFDTLTSTVTEPGYQMITGGYDMLVESGMSDEEARAAITEQSSVLGLTREHIDALIDYYLACGNDLSDATVSSYIMNGVADEVYNRILEEYDQETADSARTMMTDAIGKYLAQSGQTTDEFAADYIAEMLGEQMPEILAEEGLTYASADIETRAHDAIQDFRGQMLVNPDQEAAALIDELSASILDKFPDDVNQALEEIQDLDVFGLIVGSVFFKAAGLLLPIVYTIMTANNLIAGQVDSGSMAYVLSTPTKRNNHAKHSFYILLSKESIYPDSFTPPGFRLSFE